MGIGKQYDNDQKTIEMKRFYKISTLIFGIAIALVAVSSANLHAENIEKNEIDEIDIVENEMLEVIEQILENETIAPEKDKSLKIYNEKNQLVYESRDEQDERLQLLLRRSDLMLQTDSSSYYLLGD